MNNSSSNPPSIQLELNLQTVEWRDIPGYEGMYQVSNDGRMRSHKYGYWREMKIGKHNHGYRSVNLSKNAQTKTWLIHRLVLLAFIGACPDELQVNHKNGNKADNHLGNLEYVTVSENHEHARKVLGKAIGGTSQFGIKNGSAKLTDNDVREIRRLLAEGNLSQEKIAKMFGINQTKISNIKLGKNWTHIK